MKRCASFIIVGVLSVLPWTAFGQMTHYLNYQGRLTDGTNLVNADVELVLRLYNQETKGTILCEDSNTVTVVDGLYSTIIGDNVTSGSLANLMFESPWLEAEVDGTVLEPREMVVPVLYALNALEAQVAGSADFASWAAQATYATTASNVAPNSINSASISNGTVDLEDLARHSSVAILQAHVDSVGSGASDFEFFEFTMPQNATLSSVQVYAAAVTATATVDVKESGTTVLSGSVTPAAGSVVSGSISDTLLANGNALTVHITTDGGGSVGLLTVTIVMNLNHVP